MLFIELLLRRLIYADKVRFRALYPCGTAVSVSRAFAVDECEIKVIKETFKDLCNVNGGSMRIDKETFLQYLPLPGLLGGERLIGDVMPNQQ